MQRYAAKLLFQFRTSVNGRSSRRRTCEERIIVFRATSAAQALKIARQKGRDARYNSLNEDGNPVRFEFVGVCDLLRLGPECGPDEVWYEIRERLSPMERRRTLIPRDAKLLTRAK